MLRMMPDVGRNKPTPAGVYGEVSRACCRGRCSSRKRP